MGGAPPTQSRDQEEREQQQLLAYVAGSSVWVPHAEPPPAALADGGSKRPRTAWRLGRVEAVVGGRDPAQVELEVSLAGDPLAPRVRLPARACHPATERDGAVDDLVRSDFIHEPGILHTLRLRYSIDAIYTYSGGVLIAANPHKRLRHLYGPRMMAQYRAQPLGALAPHVYAIAEAAFAAMMADEQRQSILISGESGAGKTESAKLVMQFLAHRAAGGAAADAGAPPPRGAAAAAGATPIEEQVLESNPLLEAFGNAKTERNDNSSRFGKFVELHFDAAGRVQGASIATYLLERSRVVAARVPERSFHVFYQLAAGADAAQRAALRLGEGAGAFRYLAQTDTAPLAGVDDAAQFAQTMDAMKIVGLTPADVGAVLRVVAAVLHLGNVEFADDAATDAAALAGPGAAEALGAAAALLGVGAAALEAALTTRVLETRGGSERILKRLGAGAAAESRDALAKALYSRLFDWLVSAVNRRIGGISAAMGDGAPAAAAGPRTVGILDIYGFECFRRNSFEQLCINLANEHLQQAFNAHVFKGEQAEYEAEGIPWSRVDFVDNAEVIHLLEGGGGGGGGGQPGVFPLIDEACRLPRASHRDLAHALRSRLAGRPRFGAPPRDQHAFTVEHYAGEVVYVTEALLEKNADYVVAEHARLMAGSAAPLVRELFAEAATDDGGGAGDAPPGRQRRSAFALSSVGARFRRQLGGLMAALRETQPHFIRCVKPNTESRPASFCEHHVLEQLRAGGVLEAVRIAAKGFPTRKAYAPFARRFAVPLLGSGRLAGLLPLTAAGCVDWGAAAPEAVRDAAVRVLHAARLEGWQAGHTRVFLRAGQLALLEGARTRVLAEAATKIQAALRGMDARRRLRAARAAARRVQAAWRALLVRRAAERARRDAAAVRLQAAWRAHVARAAFLRQRAAAAATLIQAYTRGFLARRAFVRDTEAGRRAAARAASEARRAAAATAIQRHVRGLLARRRAAAMAAGAARLRALAAERDAALEQRAALRAELAEALARAQRAEADAGAKAARIGSLESQLGAARAEVAAAAAIAAASVSGAGAEADAARKRTAELEAAHERATEALRAELAVAVQQRDEAAAGMARLQREVAALRAALETQQAEAAAAAAALSEEAAQRRLLQEAAVSTRAQEEALLQRAAAAEAAVQEAARAAEAEAAIALAAAERRAAEAQAHAEARLFAATAEGRAAATAAANAQDRAARLHAEAEALAARVAQLEAQAAAAAARERVLSSELEAARRAAHARPPALGRSGSGAASAPAAALLQAAEHGAAEGAAGGLPPERAAAVAALVDAAVAGALPMVEVPVGGGHIAVPQAAWVVAQALLHWAAAWDSAAHVAAAAAAVQDAVVAAAAGSVPAACRWLGASVATGALLKVRALGRPGLEAAFRLGDDFIGFACLHEALGAAAAAALPVDAPHLLSADAKKWARLGGAAAAAGGAGPWRELVAGLAGVAGAARAAGVPPAACRALSWAALHFVDGELLNAMLLRREFCSVSAARALGAGLAALRGWAEAEGGPWCCSAEEADAALARARQAVRWLAGGKDDAMRRAAKGVDVVPDLRRQCSALTLQQVRRLAEFQHDDWLDGAGAGTQTLALLEALGALAARNRARLAAAGGGGEDEGGGGGGEDEDEDLLVDSRAAFELFRSSQPFTRRLLTEAARSCVQAPAAGSPAARAPGAAGLLPVLDQIDAACRRSVQKTEVAGELAFLRAGPRK